MPSARTVYANNPTKNAETSYIDNSIRTTKYRWYNFVVLNLLEQFRKAANIYFLVISVFTSLPTSAKDTASLVGTFVLVLLVTAIKEGYEDLQRAKADTQLNTRQTTVLRSGSWVSIPWREVLVGDMLKVVVDQFFPCDLVYISGADAEYGICYIDTQNLDGETNLKSHTALTKTKGVQTLEQLNKFAAIIESEAPHVDLYNYTGSMTLNGERIPLGPAQVLLRGCVLRNTKFVYAIAINTGHECKLMLNAKEVPYKMSNLTHTMNRCLYIVFAFQAVVCLLNTIAAVAVSQSVLSTLYSIHPVVRHILGSTSQLGLPQSPGVLGFESYLTFVVSYSNLIPISLYVGIEVMKLCQKFLVDSDALMYHAESDTPALSRTSNLIEELGQVEFIFSDKTGTLTCNVMEFLKCSIAGKQYGDRLTEVEMELASLRDISPTARSKNIRPLNVAALSAAGAASGDLTGRPATPTGVVVMSNPTATHTRESGAAGGSGAESKAEGAGSSAESQTGESRALGGNAAQEEGSGEGNTGSVGANRSVSKRGRKGKKKLRKGRTAAAISTSGNGVENEGLTDKGMADSGIDPSIPALPEGSDRCSPHASATFGYTDRRTWDALRGIGSAAADAVAVREFWTLMSVCHTVVPEFPDDDPSRTEEVKYQAASPDEKALTEAAREMGFFFHSRTPESITVRVLGREQRYELLNVLEFNSTRKRMSVIVRDPRGRLRLMCKGADNVIMERLKPPPHTADVHLTNQHLLAFSEVGLRTLCFGVRDVGEEEYEEWSARYADASVALGAERKRRLAALAEEMEKDLDLVGASAIEDKLQAGVPDCIATLARAGIKLWVLTGDKEETAINIGYSCHLLTKNMRLLRLSRNNTGQELEDNLKQLLQEVEQAPQGSEVGIVIDGATLKLAFMGESGWSEERVHALRQTFLSLALLCSVCVCCRVSPKQKADVVSLVKNNLPVITLAIGDGANDVSMIRAAHIGIGISGQEGMQAVRASDYAIAQFRFLERLLLVHGRWGYNRLTKFVLYYFYKNMLVALAEAVFAWYCGFSGQIFFPNWLQLCYNAVYTSYPCVFALALEQDVSARSVKCFPKLYQSGPRREYFNARLFMAWMALALYHAVVCFYVPTYIMVGVNTSDGKPMGHWFLGIASFSAVILVVTLKMALETHHWTWIAKYITLFSLALYLGTVCFLCLPPIAATFEPLVSGVMFALLASPRFYLALLATSVVALLPDVAYKAYVVLFHPRPVHIVQEMERLAARGGGPDPFKQLGIVVDSSGGKGDAFGNGTAAAGSATAAANGATKAWGEQQQRTTQAEERQSEGGDGERKYPL